MDNNKREEIQETEISTSIGRKSSDVRGITGDIDLTERKARSSGDACSNPKTDVVNEPKEEEHTLEASELSGNIEGSKCRAIPQSLSSPPQQQIAGVSTSDCSQSEDLLTKPFGDHPYKELLLNFQPTSEQLSPTNTVQCAKSIKETPLDEINTEEGLKKCIAELKQYNEIGVDVEYSDHGYKGVCCLLQISTVDKDYLVYAKELNDTMNNLNEVFTDPNVVKIFHSAANDLRWLQQDLDIFIVNMFDTQLALKRLGRMDGLGLHHLLKDFGVKKDTSLQRADFRKRPLPANYKDYARTDSHYLINIYHKLKNELIRANLLNPVFEECNNNCKIVYKKVDDPSYLCIVDKIQKQYQQQLSVLESLNKWRHGIAEYLDQNPGKILSKNNMEALVTKMPTESQDVLKIAKSKHVKEHVDEIVAIIRGGTQSQPHYKIKNKQQTSFNRKRKVDQTDFQRNQGFPKNKRRKNHREFSEPNTFNSQKFDLRNTLRTRGTFRQNRFR